MQPIVASRPIRVVAIDDYPGIHEAVVGLLSPALEIQVVGMAEGGAVGLRLVRELQPDVLILDIRLAAFDRMGGLTLAEKIRDTCPSVAILAWTGYADIASYRRLMALGVPGYLHKPIGGAELIAAVRLLAGGGRVIGKDPIIAAEEHGIERLSDTEWEVLQLLADELTNAEIAAEMGIALSTAEAYVSRVLRKLGAKSRAGAVARGYDFGLLLPPDAARAAGLR
jgi:DNA-binding NarL/FixJ family response regulator